MSKTYRFIVREVTEREAYVTAESAAVARSLLKRWSDRNDAEGFDLADDGAEDAPIQLGDIESVGFTFRQVAPDGDA